MEFGPLHLWEQMTIIAKGVVVALLLLSIWSLYVTIERALVYRKAKKQSLAFARQVSTLFAQDRAKEARTTEHPELSEAIRGCRQVLVAGGVRSL